MHIFCTVEFIFKRGTKPHGLSGKSRDTYFEPQQDVTNSPFILHLSLKRASESDKCSICLFVLNSVLLCVLLI